MPCGVMVTQRSLEPSFRVRILAGQQIVLAALLNNLQLIQKEMRELNNLFSYEAYLFDMDGTLVSSEKLKGEALVRTCNSFGGIADVTDYKEVMGQSYESVRDHFYRISGINAQFENFDESFNQFFYSLISSKVELTCGVHKLVDLLKSEKKKIGIVTSANHWMAKEILAKVKMNHTFDTIVAREDVLNHKPAPDSYIRALNFLSVNPKEALIFEDSESGIAAAVATGSEVVAIRHEFNENHNFDNADLIISDFQELVI